MAGAMLVLALLALCTSIAVVGILATPVVTDEEQLDEEARP